jgi:hypothetical protein
LEGITDYCEKDVRPAGKDLLKLLKSASRLRSLKDGSKKLNAVERKFSTKMYNYVSRIQL